MVRYLLFSSKLPKKQVLIRYCLPTLYFTHTHTHTHITITNCGQHLTLLMPHKATVQSLVQSEHHYPLQPAIGYNVYVPI